MKRVLSEPLVHFLVAGAALFVLFGLSDGRGGVPGGAAGRAPARIVVTPGRVTQLAAAFERNWKRPPSAGELQGLIEDYVREEVYYREAMAMGLDRDDVVIRRRLRQKYEFLGEDLGELTIPSDEVLQGFLEDHAEEFRVEPRVAFRQVYVSTEKRDDGAMEYAKQTLAQLRAGVSPRALGDTIVLPPESGLSRLPRIAATFGDGFAKALLEVRPGAWQGPIESSYGLHLVEVLERVAGYLPDLDEVRAAVQREWLAARKAQVKEQIYQRLRERYVVIVQDPGTRREPALASAAPAASATAR